MSCEIDMAMWAGEGIVFLYDNLDGVAVWDSIYEVSTCGLGSRACTRSDFV